MRAWVLLFLITWWRSSEVLAYEGDFTLRDFATRVFRWSGVNGVPGYNTDPSGVLGFPAPNATPCVPDNSSLFSFGWGGFVEVGFDRPIVNIPAGIDQKNPHGFDLILFGNAFYVGCDPSFCQGFVEPGYVQVGVDVNGNGVPDENDPWYLLLPRNPDPRDENGIPRFPLPDRYFGVYELCSDPIIGYADVTPTDNRGNPLVPDDPSKPGIQAGSAGGDGFDLDWAVDEQTGEPVQLPVAHFVRIVHAGNADLGMFGHSSTEIDAVAILRPLGDTNGDGCVNDADLATVLVNFGRTGEDLPGDANHDGVINDTDLTLVLRDFAQGC